LFVEKRGKGFVMVHVDGVSKQFGNDPGSVVVVTPALQGSKRKGYQQGTVLGKMEYPYPSYLLEQKLAAILGRYGIIRFMLYNTQIVEHESYLHQLLINQSTEFVVSIQNKSLHYSSCL